MSPPFKTMLLLFWKKEKVNFYYGQYKKNVQVSRIGVCKKIACLYEISGCPQSDNDTLGLNPHFCLNLIFHCFLLHKSSFEQVNIF